MKLNLNHSDLDDKPMPTVLPHRTACMTAVTVIKVRTACVPPSPRMSTPVQLQESRSVAGGWLSVVSQKNTYIFFSVLIERCWVCNKQLITLNNSKSKSKLKEWLVCLLQPSDTLLLPFCNNKKLIYMKNLIHLADTLMLTISSYPSHQANSLHHVQKVQCMTTTWPAAIVPAVPLARLTILARPLSPKWMAVAVPREPTWTRPGNVCPVRAVPAMIKTPLFLLGRLSAKMVPHGK